MQNLMKIILLLAICLSASKLGGQEQAPPTIDNTGKTPASKTGVTKIIQCIEKGCAKWRIQIPDEGGIVFIYGSRRYTIYIRKGVYNPSVTFWVRPEGTTSRKEVDSFADNKMDGTVNSGSDGLGRRNFDCECENNPQWRGYWQKRYNEAIADTLVYIAEHPAR